MQQDGKTPVKRRLNQRPAVIPMMVGFVFIFCFSAFAQEGESGAAENKKEKNYVIAPMVLSNPNIGSGGGVSALCFYSPDPDDTVSPKSSAGATGFYTDTDSYFVSLFNQSYFQQDTWRLGMAVPYGRIENELDISDIGEVRFASVIKGVAGRLQRRVYGDFFAGVRLSYISIDYEEGNDASKDYFERYGVSDRDTGSFGIQMSYDSRDSQRYPYKGLLAEASFNANPEWLGADEGYFAVEGFVNSFHRILIGHVIALRAYGRFTPSDTPYSGLSTLGRRSDLRGYVSGEIIADNMISTQAEYRWFFTRKWGVVFFGGAAALYDGNVSNIDSDMIYYSGGLGLRYLLHEENRVNFRVDYAWGEADEQGVYVSISEAF